MFGCILGFVTRVYCGFQVAFQMPSSVASSILTHLFQINVFSTQSSVKKSRKLRMNEKSHCACFELIVSYFVLMKPHSVRNPSAQETSVKMWTKPKNVFCALGSFLFTHFSQ